MSHTDGKLTEGIYIERIKALGKRAFNFRFADAADAFGRNQRLVLTERQPADFLTTLDGQTFYAECKETTNPRGFNTGLVSTHQRGIAVQVNAARGNYFFVVNNMEHERLFFVPATFLLTQRGRVAWEDFQPYLWPGETACPPM